MSSKDKSNDNNEADKEIFSSENEEIGIAPNENQDENSQQSIDINAASCMVKKDNNRVNDNDETFPHSSNTITNETKVEHIEESLSKTVISDRVVGETVTTPCHVEEAAVETEKRLSNESQHTGKQVYRLKWIEWHNKKIPIVTQNENGPCPLIAIANILLLRGKIQLRAATEFITASDLMDYIGDAIMESMPKDLRGAIMLNYEQNMHDAIAILPQLHTGLDVNIKFTGVQHFEYTPQCIIFDLLNIPLYHGWLVDPQCQETVDALGNLGYNQLVEKIILNKCSSDTDLVTQALIAEQFLERTASQLTYHGLCELNMAMKQEELAVLFRNNHFSTILKKRVVMERGEANAPESAREELHELFQLVTDQGFLHEPRVVWETLCNIEGDGQFVDCRFATVPPKSVDSFISEGTLTEEQQINQDYLVALSLQEEQKKEQERDQAWQDYRDTISSTPEISDEELARRRQDEQQTQQQPGRAPSPSASSSGRLPPSPGGERGKKAVCNVM